MRRGLPRAALPWLLWSIPAAFITAISTHEYHLPLWRVAGGEALPWYYWALVTPVIMRFARRHPAETLQRWRGRALHIWNGIMYGAGCGIVATISQVAFDLDRSQRSIQMLASRNILFWAIFGLIFYALITAAGFVRDGQERVRERELAASRLQAELVEAQLNGLRMQLQPHFLFNTLNTAAMYVREGDSDTSVRVLTRLSELLRRVLDTGSEPEVPLAMEIEQVERYLEIESVRFSDRLSVRIDVPDELRDARVPNLALQPLVENAVRHGIAKQSDSGRISISAYREDGNLIIRVFNTGPELESEAITVEGIGVSNTRQRLAHLYGERGKLTLFNEDSGVVCEMRVPYHTNG
jgi:two-component system, LytTR family, sensor kinase